MGRSAQVSRQEGVAEQSGQHVDKLVYGELALFPSSERQSIREASARVVCVGQPWQVPQWLLVSGELHGMECTQFRRLRLILLACDVLSKDGSPASQRAHQSIILGPANQDSDLAKHTI